MLFLTQGAGLPSARRRKRGKFSDRLPARGFSQLNRTCFRRVNLNQYVKGKFCRALVVQTDSDAQTVDGMTPVECSATRRLY